MARCGQRPGTFRPFFGVTDSQGTVVVINAKSSLLQTAVPISLCSHAKRQTSTHYILCKSGDISETVPLLSVKCLTFIGSEVTYATYKIAAIPMTLSDPEGHSPILTCQFLPARRYADGARILAMVLAVCVSCLYLSVTRRYCVKTAEQIGRSFLAQMISSAYPTICCKNIRVSLKMRAFLLDFLQLMPMVEYDHQIHTQTLFLNRQHSVLLYVMLLCLQCTIS